MSEFKESDMYEPVANMLNNLGYSVHAEVKNCDITASKDGETIIVEMKKSFNLKLVYQILDRQTFAKYVYACIPRSEKSTDKNVLRLLKRIDAGLITVALDSPVKYAQIVLEPSAIKKITNSRKKTAVEREAELRSGDYNTGGITKTKLITAYKERSIELLCLCDKMEKLSKSDLLKAGFEQKTYSILYMNYYKWFKKDGRALYSVSGEGKKALEDEKYSVLVEYYKEKAEKYYVLLND